MARMLHTHHLKMLSKTQPKPATKKCSCPNNTVCPSDGQSIEKNIVYQATVSSSDGATEKYISPPSKQIL